ncbi:MAG: hypothetical protein OXH67_10540 [Acidimicrobiaceae bacterium]|nr:hypothetical protein [Acidimicrobiaceae bacterium]MDE0666018.1 hypothetical protein [Acidimicrobiaceae bacterium]
MSEGPGQSHRQGMSLAEGHVAALGRRQRVAGEDNRGAVIEHPHRRELARQMTGGAVDGGVNWLQPEPTLNLLDCQADGDCSWTQKVIASPGTSSLRRVTGVTVTR